MNKETNDINEAHKSSMQKLNAEQREKHLARKNADRGLVLVHTGNGKGKSSSAFGVLARALGWGQSVGVVQFVKGKWKTGEKTFFTDLGVEWHAMGEGFTWETQDREKDIAIAEATFEQAKAMLSSGDYDLVLLDEINIVLRYDYLNTDEVMNAVQGRSERTSVILTGRDAKSELIEIADLVTDMTEIKHPYKAGIRAKQGIDF